jgi:hypothetical protein
MTQQGSAWRKPATGIAAAALAMSLTGGLVTWHRDHEGQQESRLNRLEQRDAAAAQALADNQADILARLDGVREGLGALRDELHRESDTIERRVEALERRR